jgi:hypothetical protein
MAQKRHLAANLVPVALLAFAACGFSQTQSPAARPPARSAPTPPPAVAPPPAPATAPSLLDQPAQPAKMSLNSGKLTVLADNSSLSEILHQISHASGMKIEGLQSAGNADQRIFGSYGPGAPRDVLSDLLSGSGYNVLMLGETSSGAPRELALTSRSAPGAPGAPPQNSDATANEDGGDEDVQATQYQDDQQQNVVPQPNPPEMRSPQQMLRELQRMHEQQQQQQQDQPQPN